MLHSLRFFEIVWIFAVAQTGAVTDVVPSSSSVGLDSFASVVIRVVTDLSVDMLEIVAPSGYTAWSGIDRACQVSQWNDTMHVGLDSWCACQVDVSRANVVRVGPFEPVSTDDPLWMSIRFRNPADFRTQVGTWTVRLLESGGDLFGIASAVGSSTSLTLASLVIVPPTSDKRVTSSVAEVGVSLVIGPANGGDRMTLMAPEGYVIDSVGVTGSTPGTPVCLSNAITWILNSTTARPTEFNFTVFVRHPRYPLWSSLNYWRAEHWQDGVLLESLSVEGYDLSSTFLDVSLALSNAKTSTFRLVVEPNLELIDHIRITSIDLDFRLVTTSADSVGDQWAISSSAIDYMDLQLNAPSSIRSVNLLLTGLRPLTLGGSPIISVSSFLGGAVRDCTSNVSMNGSVPLHISIVSADLVMSLGGISLPARVGDAAEMRIDFSVPINVSDRVEISVQLPPDEFILRPSRALLADVSNLSSITSYQMDVDLQLTLVTYTSTTSLSLSPGRVYRLSVSVVRTDDSKPGDWIVSINRSWLVGFIDGLRAIHSSQFSLSLRRHSPLVTTTVEIEITSEQLKFELTSPADSFRFASPSCINDTGLPNGLAGDVSCQASFVTVVGEGGLSNRSKAIIVIVNPVTAAIPLLVDNPSAQPSTSDWLLIEYVNGTSVVHGWGTVDDPTTVAINQMEVVVGYAPVAGSLTWFVFQLNVTDSVIQDSPSLMNIRLPYGWSSTCDFAQMSLPSDSVCATSDNIVTISFPTGCSLGWRLFAIRGQLPDSGTNSTITVIITTNNGDVRDANTILQVSRGGYPLPLQNDDVLQLLGDPPFSEFTLGTSDSRCGAVARVWVAFKQIRQFAQARDFAFIKLSYPHGFEQGMTDGAEIRVVGDSAAPITSWNWRPDSGSVYFEISPVIDETSFAEWNVSFLTRNPEYGMSAGFMWLVQLCTEIDLTSFSCTSSLDVPIPGYSCTPY